MKGPLHRFLPALSGDLLQGPMLRMCSCVYMHLRKATLTIDVFPRFCYLTGHPGAVIFACTIAIDTCLAGYTCRCDDKENRAVALFPMTNWSAADFLLAWHWVKMCVRGIVRMRL